MKYTYAARFTYVSDDDTYPNGVYEVQFIDFDTCFTFGETITEALENAEDVLNLHLWNLEEQKAEIKAPTNIKDIQQDEDSFISLVSADTFEYRKLHDTKAVRKTVSIPRWLDTMAAQHNLNYSNIFQNALMKEINVSLR